MMTPLDEPIEFGRRMTTSVTIADDEPTIGGHALVAPIARNLVRQGGVKLETSARQRIERGAGAPVERQKSASLAGCRRGHLGPLDDDDVDPAASEEVRDAGSDHAAPANHDPHDVSTDIYRSAAPAQVWFIGYPLARPPG